MISGLHVGTELRRFGRSKMAKISIIAICVMPILYSTLYLWSFWNPFGRLDSLPVALVNSDEGAVVDGERLVAGDEVVDGLLDDASLDWRTTTRQDAIDGVRTGRYYFSVELPADFTAAVTSPTGDDPRQATLQATYNDANGYLSSVIGENAMQQVLNVVSDRIGAESVDKLLVGLLDAGTGLTRAADGAATLDDGLGQLHDGANELVDGLGRAREGTSELASGTSSLVDGVGELDQGSGRLADGTGQLRDGVDRLADGVDTAADGLQALRGSGDAIRDAVDTAGSAMDRINTAAGGLEEAASGVAEFQGGKASDIRAIADTLRGLPDPASQRAVADLDELADSLETTGLGPESPMMSDIRKLSGDTADLDRALNDPSSALRTGVDALTGGSGKIDELIDGIHQLRDGAHQVDDGANALHDGIGTLADGANRLNDGAGQLNDGAQQLFDGGTRLRDGISEAHDGAGELSGGLRDGADQVPEWSPEHRARVSSVMGGPVNVGSGNDAGSNTFGGGLAPFFFALALYIGGIITFLLLRPLQARAISSGVGGFRAAVDGLLPAALIGFAQAAVVIGLTLVVVPLNPAHTAGLFGVAFLTSIMFIAINQMFNATLGTGPGKVASMAFLMIQLVASGGLYPVETEPKILELLHPFMPMTYAVNGFRQVLYGEIDSRLPIAIVAMAAITLGALLLTAGAARRARTWDMEKLHPPVPL